MLNPCFNLLELARLTVGRTLAPGGLAVDGTAGNGQDTLFLAGLVGEAGQVLAFEIQPQALRKTSALLERAGLSPRVRLLTDGHENLARYLPAGQTVDAAMFNLGFLPGGGNRELTTVCQTTLAALGALQAFIRPGGGVLSIHCYSGHKGGQEESRAVLDWAGQLPREQWWVYRYETYNKKQGVENLLLIERLGKSGRLPAQRIGGSLNGRVG